MKHTKVYEDPILQAIYEMGEECQVRVVEHLATARNLAEEGKQFRGYIILAIDELTHAQSAISLRIQAAALLSATGE